MIWEGLGMKHIPLVLLCETVSRVAGGDPSFAAQCRGSELHENLFKQRKERERDKFLPSRSQNSLKTRILKAQTINEPEKKLGLCTLKIHRWSHDFFMKTCWVHAF